jgi:AraC-like DNA-binding protein
MDAAALDAPCWRFSTDTLPEAERRAALGELYGNSILAWDTLPDAPVHADFTQRRLPGLVFLTGSGGGLRCWRAREHLADGVADLCLAVRLTGPACIWLGRGRQLTVSPSDATLLSAAEPFAALPMSRDRDRRGRGFCLRLPRTALTPLVSNVDDAVLRLIPRNTGALKLLANYVGMLDDEEALATPELRRLVVNQIYDLVALAIGATRDAAAVAEQRGVRAARLRAIKTDIAERANQHDLTVGSVAAHQGISESYVRKLFESDGTSFSEFVLGQRLVRAHRFLTDPRFAARSITSVAFDSGFGDVSYFNRSFRRRYGATPSEIRAEAQHRHA